MRPAFAGHPFAELLLFLSLGVWLVIEAPRALNRRPDATIADRGSLMALRLWTAGGILLAFLALKVTATRFSYNPAVFAIALVVVWAGIGLRWWSFRTLGRYFTFAVMTSPDQPVITTGPYRVLRHPSYAGILLILGGIGLGYGNWLSFAALTLFPLIGFINRIQVEEAVLSQNLGSSYTTYASGRKRLIPFVW
jgi:protein-S-isoprenylcysteine O-methyltransferase Ste14